MGKAQTSFQKWEVLMFTRSGKARLAFVSVGVWAKLTVCSAVVLMTTACGIRVSATDFPAFALSEPVPDATPAETPRQ